MNNSGQALGHGFIKGFDAMGDDLSPVPSGHFFFSPGPCGQSCTFATLCMLDLAIFRQLILLSLRATIARLSLRSTWVPRDIALLILQESSIANEKK